MAIQFNCPSCGAMIRVPDTAGGKKGTCPRCSEKLLVPDLASATAATSSPPEDAPSAQPSPGKLELPRLDFGASQPAASKPQPSAGLPAFGQLPELEDPMPAVPSALGLPPLAGMSPRAGQNKKQPKKNQFQGAWIVPVIAILGVVGFLAWFMWKSKPKLEGELTAQTVHNLEVKPGVIPGKASGLSAEDLDEVLKHLKAEPAHWSSTSSKIALTGAADGVEVAIRPGTASHFVRVQPSTNPAFREFVTAHFTELDQPRLASITQNAPKLYAGWKSQFSKNEPLTNQKVHRDLVLLPALTTGIGYHLEAVVNNNIYPCVYEDSDGHVYFLLPNAAKSFRLQGRRVAGGLHLPANFTVKLTGTVEAPAAPESKKKTTKTKIEREQENEGMNPDLYKQNLEEHKQERRKGRSKGMGMKKDPNTMPTEDLADQLDTESKSSKKKSEMMMDGDEDVMNDEMPAKSKPKRGAAKAMPKDGMMEPDEEMMEQPKKPKRVSVMN